MPRSLVSKAPFSENSETPMVTITICSDAAMPSVGIFQFGFVIGEHTFVTGQSCSPTLAVLSLI